MPNTSEIFNEIETRCIANYNNNNNNTNKDNDEDDDSRAMACALMPSLLFPHSIYSLCCSTDPPAIAHLIGLRFDMNDDFVRDVAVVVGSIWNLLLAELSADKAVARSLDSFALLWSTYIRKISDIFLVFFLYCTFIIRWWQIRFDVMLETGQQVDLIPHRYLQQDNCKQMQSPYDKSGLPITLFTYVYMFVNMSILLSACPMKRCTFRWPRRSWCTFPSEPRLMRGKHCWHAPAMRPTYKTINYRKYAN